jgi:NitT/TauT family transport system substrate-binding protein
MTRAQASALLFSGAVFHFARRAARAQATVPVRVGVVALESSSEVYYAKELGTFAKVGLEVDIQPFQSTPAVLSAVAAGALDIAYSTVPSIVVARERRLPFLFVAPASMITAAQPPTELLIRSDSSIRSGRDLNGKILAVPGLGTLNELGARAWIDQNGGDSTTVKFVEVAFPLMTAALEAGRVDAASVTEPFVAMAKRAGHRVLANPNLGIGANFLGTGFVATASWANSHPDMVARFVSAVRETGIWANQNPDKTVAMLAAYTNVDPSIIASMVRARYAERATAALIQPVIDVSAKYNGFSSFPAQEIIYAAPR